jgi:hypothetical protein
MRQGRRTACPERVAAPPAGHVAARVGAGVTAQAQLDLFADTETGRWPEGDLTWIGKAHWDDRWLPCDLGEARYYRCARDHGVDARCSVVYRLTHPVHRRDLPGCSQYPCNGRRCIRR